MANSFATMQAIAREALPRLIDNLVFPNLIYRDTETAEASKGDTIQIRKPPAFVAQEFNAATGVTPQDINDSAILVTLDKIATVDVEASAVEAATSIDDLNRIFIEPAAAALAEKINKDGLALYKDVYNYIGLNSNPADLTTLAAARLKLNESKAPAGERCTVLAPLVEADLLAVPAIVNAEKCGDTKALKEGAIGRVMGFDNYMSQGVANHESGIDAANGLKVAANVTAGATKLNISGTTLTGKFAKGDVLEIGGKQYVVTADSASASSNAISNVNVYPALPAITANETVTALVGPGAQSLAFHPAAFAFVTRPMYNPDGEGVSSYVTNFNGIALRVTKGYNQQYKKSMYSMDVLYGFKTLNPDLACRIGV